MIKLEETIRELKVALKQKRGDDAPDISKPYHLIKADEKIEELTRSTAILTKSKYKEEKLMKMVKKGFEKNIEELNVKITEL
jgi:hypothetical protein